MEKLIKVSSNPANCSINSPNRWKDNHITDENARALSMSSLSGSLSSSMSDLDDINDDYHSIRNRVQTNSRGFFDFRVRKLSRATFGRRCIEIVEQDMHGKLTGQKWSSLGETKLFSLEANYNWINEKLLLVLSKIEQNAYKKLLHM